MEDSNKKPRGKSKPPVPVKVEFHGVVLEGVCVNGKNYVAMKPIVEGMGLGWEKQLSRMQSHPVLKDEVSPIRGVPSAGGPQTMMCLPEDRLQFWMAIINPLKVKESIRDKVVTYQKEAAKVLHAAFTKGVADTNMRVLAIDSKRAMARVMTDIKQDILLMLGKKPKPYDFSNEHRLVNWALTGEFCGLSEDDLHTDQIRLLSDLRRRNAVLIATGMSYDLRKKALEVFAAEWRFQHEAKLIGEPA